ncbi:MAG: hypothetical protein FWD56_04290 [Bacteroidales bacterium]|nr:hypothetical protein [Bacteroidales bacterium]
MNDNREFDALGELFFRKLESHRMDVGGAGWGEVERRLNKPKNRTVVWLWRSGAVAAAAILAFLLFNEPFSKQEVIPDGSQKMALVDELPEVREAEIADPQIITATPLIEYSIKKIAVTADLQEILLALEQEIAETTDNPIIESTTVATVPDTPKERRAPASDLILIENLHKDISTTKKDRGWTLAVNANTSSGRSQSFINGYYTDQQYGYSQTIKSSGNNDYAADLSASIESLEKIYMSHFASIRHMPPVSFGVNVRKKIGKQIDLESGIVYTFLSSRLSWSGSDTNCEVRQSLHYVGVPANIVVSLWNNRSNWQIYLSSGVMVEKGLRGIYVQDLQTAPRNTFTTVKSSIDGFQWSLNGALGVNYKLSKNIGFYLEPRFGYSFDCDQPISMRTEWPLYVGVGFGVNYQFK